MFSKTLALLTIAFAALVSAQGGCDNQKVYDTAQEQLGGYPCVLSAFNNNFNNYNACNACDFNVLAGAVGYVLSDPNCKKDVEVLTSKVNDLTYALNQACGK
ncbi:hypothetical protein HDU97_002112 [Phlyctochytrium planicorne]|nr:hypothetical protein HDU97_002112 [Phlyctochytrium planicorne]